MEGTRRAFSARWGAGRLCSRLVTVGASECPNRPRRARERLGRLHAADPRRAVDRHQADAARKDGLSPFVCAARLKASRRAECRTGWLFRVWRSASGERRKCLRRLEGGMSTSYHPEPQQTNAQEASQPEKELRHKDSVCVHFDDSDWSSQSRPSDALYYVRRLT